MNPTKDDIGTPSAGAPSSPANPADSASVASTSAELESSRGEIDAAVSAALDTAAAALAPEYTAVAVLLQSAIGRVDTELSAIVAPVERALERATDGVLREVVTAAGELSTQGLWVPYDAETTIAAVADESGAAIMAALSGEQWTPEAAPAPAAVPVDQPGASEGEGDAETIPFAPVTLAPLGATVPAPTPAPASLPDAPAGALDAPGTYSASLSSPVSAGDCGCAAKCPAPVVTVTVPAPVCPAPPTGAPPEPPLPPAPPESDSEPEPEPESSGRGPRVGGDFTEIGTEDDDAGLTLGAGPPIPIATVPAAPPVHSMVSWADPEVCRRVKEQWDALTRGGILGTTLYEVAAGSYAGDAWRRLQAGLPAIVDYFSSGFDSKVADATYESHLKTSSARLGGLPSAAESLLALPDKIVPRKGAAWELGQRVAQASIAESDTHIPLSYLATSWDYAFKAANPQFIPSQGELDGLLRTGTITEAHWTCLTAAHGIIPELQRAVVRASEWTYSPFEVISLWRRGAIDRLRAEELLARAGADPASKELELRSLTETLPGLADIVRFMVRDAADDQVAAEFNYDADFKEKLDGIPGTPGFQKMRKWMDALGVTEETMRLYWRAHWEIPSPTALYEMLHRLRPDRPEVDAWHQRHPNWKVGDPQPANDPRPNVTTAADIAHALRVNDMAPGFVERMMSISYHPVNRTDAIDAYHAGAWNETQLYHAMRDNGYNEADAWRLVDIQRVKAGRRRANVGAGRTIRQVLADYRDGIVTGIAADAELRPLIPDAGHRAAAIRAADDQAHATVLRAAIKRARRAFFVGEWDGNKVRAVLGARGIDPARIGQLLFQWDDERQGRYREPTVRMLVEWARLGIITADDAEQRALNLGFTPVDARRIVLQGIDARTREVVKAVEKAKKNVQSALKTAKQLAKEDKTELEKLRKENEKRIEKLQKQQEKLQKELEKRQKEEE